MRCVSISTITSLDITFLRNQVCRVRDRVRYCMHCHDCFLLIFGAFLNDAFIHESGQISGEEANLIEYLFVPNFPPNSPFIWQLYRRDYSFRKSRRARNLNKERLASGTRFSRLTADDTHVRDNRRQIHA